jgi:hypothetical protein
MSGYNFIRKIRTIEEQLDRLGLMMCHSRHGYHNEFGDVVGVKPKDEFSLPIYSRDAELFVGTIEALEYWLMGVEWARKYDSLLFGKKHQSNRERKEQDYRNETVVRIIKGEANECKLDQ